MASGVNVYAAGLDITDPHEAKQCCNDYDSCVAGTNLNPMEQDGMTLRNCGILDKMEEVIKKRGGKMVFFGGALHMGYGNTNKTVTLSEMLAKEFPDSFILTVLNLGGKGYDEEDYEYQVCDKCKNLIKRKGDAWQVNAAPVFDWQRYADKKYVSFVNLAKGLSEQNPSEYKNRPADYIFIFPPDTDY